ncbi:chlorophyll a/b-binding protein [Scenedesmus sp. NREL 46B-D3]|nr:chlorophyll a/b-binding protein [Scenedesmus sp. NREL 46B-D3]
MRLAAARHCHRALHQRSNAGCLPATRLTAQSRPCRVISVTSNNDECNASTSSSTQQAEESAQKQQLESPAAQQDIATAAAKFVAEAVASPVFYLVAGGAVLVSSTGEQASGILVAAAAPVTLLTALSKSSLGRQVQEGLTQKLPQLEGDAAALKQQHAEARRRSRWYGPQRLQLPAALGGGQPHLPGAVAGDYGFDPLRLSEQPQQFDQYFEAELLHARWAMLAAVGCLIPEILSMQGVELGEPVWWKVGAAKLQGGLTLNYAGIEGFRIAGKQGIGIIAACQAVLMGGPEYARQVGIKSLEPVGVFLPGDQNYPGGAPFDPLQYSSKPDEFVDQAVKEIKNGRLAMLAMLGYFVQAAVTRQGPVQNLVDFLADPVHNNVFGYLMGTAVSH